MRGDFAMLTVKCATMVSNCAKSKVVAGRVVVVMVRQDCVRLNHHQAD